jgi:hypothetical protein
MASGIPLSGFGPKGAFDAKHKRAREEAEEIDEDTVSSIALAIVKKLPRGKPSPQARARAPQEA